MPSPSQADLSWIEQLIEVGYEVGGVDLEIPEDQLATVADLSTPSQ